MSIVFVHRKPTVEEFEDLVSAVGFRGHDPQAVEIALRNTVFSVCAEEDKRVVGVARIVGDGAISFLLTNVIVRSADQRQGIGFGMVKELFGELERLPYKNIVLEVVPTPGLESFYERLGFRSSHNAPPGMVRWFNDERMTKTANNPSL